MHTQKARQKLVKKIENGEEEKSTYGIISTPILDFPVKQVVPCNMHCLMAILRKLVCRTSSGVVVYLMLAFDLHVCVNQVNLLGEDIAGNDKAVTEFERILREECKVKLAGKKKTNLTLVERLKRSRYIHTISSVWSTYKTYQLIAFARLNRPDFLHILTNYEHFFSYLDTIATGETINRVKKARKVWQLFYPLACLTVQARVEITAKEWKKMAIKFGKVFVDVYPREDVTTYIHIFVYHYGYFLEHYHGLEKFANFALEGKHSVVKRILARGTSHFSHGPAEAACQQLCALIRDELHDATIPLPTSSSSSSSRSNWARKILPTHAELVDVVKSLIIFNY